MKKVVLILNLFICLTFLVCCSDVDNRDMVGHEDDVDKIKIGLSFDSYVIERWERDRDVFVSTANELGAHVNVQSANGSAEEQVAQIEYLIENKMDVIVIIPIDFDLLKDVVSTAKANGIKVIAYDRLIKNADVDLYISFDNKEVGRLMATSLIENTPEHGKISAIFGPKSDNNVWMIEEGFNEIISKTNREIIYKDYAIGWLAETAYSAVNKTLELTEEFDGMLCGNDDLASQAVLALSEHRMAGKVSVVGQDAELRACQRVVEGTQTMTVYKPIEKLAKRAAEYAVSLAKGEGIEATDIIFDGTYYVPYEKLEPIAVTKENIDEVIIEGGFHSIEEVYLNVPEKIKK
ncbi:MAG: sugar ABC transporter substrate-binding protein [Clostridiaceae bacterium]|jgi:D-xylose transport system substrate-binding protein|nr:sugar ABC transporter substrate-binding protein [Clostridiaceae bacterium]